MVKKRFLLSRRDHIEQYLLQNTTVRARSSYSNIAVGVQVKKYSPTPTPQVDRHKITDSVCVRVALAANIGELV